MPQERQFECPEFHSGCIENRVIPKETSLRAD